MACRALIFLGLFAVFGADPVFAQRRVALVIGNASYRSVAPLGNPLNDARAVADVLRKLDFDVEVATDLDKIQMEATLRRFARSLDKTDVALFYYSGHAVQVEDRNYLLPVSASVSSDATTTLDTIALQDVSATMEAAGVRVRLLFLDACRDNPFGRALTGSKWAASPTRGLAPINVSSSGGDLFVFSTSPNNVAFDGDGKISPFSKSFVHFAAQAKLEIRQMVTRIRMEVTDSTGGRQTPWDNSSLRDDFFLVPPRPAPLFDRVTTVMLPSAGQSEPLALKAPVQPEGGEVHVSLARLPEHGDLLLHGEPVTTAQRLTPDDFAKLQYSHRDTILSDSFRYWVEDAWGNSEEGSVALLPGGVMPTPVPIAQTNVGKVEEKAVSLMGLGPNLYFTQKGTSQPAATVPIQLASNVPFGQLMLGQRVIDAGKSLDLADVERLAYLPAAGTAGQRVDVLFKPVAAVGEVKLSIDVKVTDCDRLAGAPLDTQGVTEGIIQGLIDVKAALPACKAAVAAKPDSGRFAFELGRVLAAVGRSGEAFAQYQRAAVLGHVRAHDSLGYAYTYGFGVAADLAKGRQEYEAAVAKGDVYAIHDLGNLYFEGRGVEKDLGHAFALFSQAARVGHTYSLNALGEMYNAGEGVSQDQALARRYWEASAARGDMYGIQNVGFAFLDGIGAEKDPAKALDFFKRASDMGHPQAPNNIGRLYAVGLGVAPNPAEALKWYALGSDRGDGWASYNLAEMLRGNQAEAARAAFYYARAAAFVTLEPANRGREALTKLDGASKAAALRNLLARLQPMEKPSASEAGLIAAGAKLARSVGVAPTKDALDDVLIAVARVDWQMQNPRTDLF
jgi:TPR repeat protein